MNYWGNLKDASGMGDYYSWALLASVVAAFILAALSPESRRRLRAALMLIVVSVAGMLICAALRGNKDLDDTAGYRWVHFASQLCFGIAVVNLAGVLLFRVLLPPVGLQPSPILRDTILGLAYVAAALTLLTRHQVNLSGIIATSAVVTAVIGFSLQDTLGNVMGGMALQMERSIGVGDWVRIGEMEGLVREIRWRQTSIETRNWDTVVIPNSVLMKSQVTVLGRRQGKPRLHRMWVNFNVDYRHPPADVIDAVERALRAERIPSVAVDPQPDCVLNEFKESFGAYAVRYWLDDFHRDAPTSSEVRTRIFVALQRAGMGMSIPAQSVFMTLEGRSRDERKRREDLSRREAALRGVAVLAPLTDEERADVAARLHVAPFRRGEVITRQGNEAHHLYIIIKGDAEVRVRGESGEDRRVATLKGGSVFGEMGLMTGEPRSATVIALTDVLCYRLDKESFKNALHSRPELAEAISRLLAERKMELDATVQGLQADGRQRRLEQTHADLLYRIRKFFTLG